MNDRPLVSCIMPTHDRRRFLPHAIDYFMRQTYERRELIIIDDGADDTGDLIPEDPRIRCIRTAHRRPLGTKRNHACTEARGDVIMHWDDDDWMADWRIAFQVDALLGSTATVCGLDRLYFYDPQHARAWQYRYPGGRPWVAGGTLCYYRSFWQAHPFADVRVGEDTRFVWRTRPENVLALRDPSFYVALLHDANTSSRPVQSRRWHRQDPALVERLMGGDVARCSPHRAAPAAFAPPARAPAPAATAPEHGPCVTVSIPYFRNRSYLRRAVDSILAQTYRNLRLVVVNDGDADPPWPVLEDITDPRLVRFDIEENRGRYFADAVVLDATPDDYFMVQDADDWSESARLAMLMQTLQRDHASAALSSSRHFRAAGRTLQRRGREAYPASARALTQQFLHRGNHHALFEVSALRALGGYYAGFRVGYDTLLVNLLLMAADVAYVDEPLYNRFAHGASLTAAPETGLSSALRRQATRQLAALYRNAHASWIEHQAGSIDAHELRARIASMVRACISPADQTALTDNAARLRAALLAQGAALASKPASTPQLHRTRSSHAPFVNAAQLPWNDWTLAQPVVRRLLQRLDELRPRRILEVGSGLSTLFLAQHAARTGADLVCLEHDPRFARRTATLLEQHGLAAAATLVVAPLHPRNVSTASYPWYDVALDGQFDFVLLDGPPQRFGRQAALPAIAPHLAAGWELWLDDGYRDHEMTCIDLWHGKTRFTARLVDIEGSGVWMLNDAVAPGSHDGAHAVAITILTGGRPHLLRRTLDSLQHCAPGLIEQHPLFVMINGGDAETHAVVAQLPFVHRCLVHETGILPIGVAVSALAAEAAALDGAQYILHLEDDWETHAVEQGWLHRARQVLDAHPHIGQVRLRHRGEPVLHQHMLTRRPIVWTQRNGFMSAPSAHYTFNPSLIRTVDVPRIFPSASEVEAQARFLSTRMAVAQLLPGVFRHIGAEDSLRLRLKR